MKATWRKASFSVLLALVPVMALGLFFDIPDPKKLFADAQLVFVGQLTSVKPSEITTTLSYVPYEGITFHWQIVEVKVLEPFKDVQKGGVVKTAMLSVDDQGIATFMLRPEVGDIFLFFLAPTPITNMFAALTAPYHEGLSVFSLHRNRQIFDARDAMNQSCDSRVGMLQALSSTDAGFAVLLELVDSVGRIVPPNVNKVRETYASEISAAPRTNVVYLEWETHINASGWRSDWPKGYVPTTQDQGRSPMGVYSR